MICTGERERERESKGGKEKRKMATQALVSSSSLTASKEAARHLLGGKAVQSPFGSRKSASFVVRAASTPPVKVCNIVAN